MEKTEKINIQEVVVYHSPQASLLPYQGNFPFAVIADPEKNLSTIRGWLIDLCHFGHGLDPRSIRADQFNRIGSECPLAIVCDSPLLSFSEAA
jgi:hypothetical protein